MEFALQASGPYETVLASARWAEERKLACFALPDHYLASISMEGASAPAYDALIQLAALARDTKDIRLSVLVSPVTFRHPAVLAKTGFTLDEISGGRFTLGIGTGWLDLEHELYGIPYPDMAERFELMEEALAYVRAAATGSGFDGKHYSMREADLNPKPSAGFELVVGGRGAVKTPTLAGRYADEFNVYPDTPEGTKARIDLARNEAAAAGRDPDALQLTSAGGVLVGRDEADYRDRLAELAEESEQSPEDLEAHFAERNTPRGTSEQIREQLADMEALGITRFYVQTMWADDLERTAETFDLIGG